MKGALAGKIVWSLLLGLVLFVPLKMIEGKIDERRELRDAVANELAATGVGRQSLTGPILALPCSERYLEDRIEPVRLQHVTVTKTRDCSLRFIPSDLQIKGAMDTNERMRGIYRVLFYGTTLAISGKFDLSTLPTPPSDVVARTYGSPELRIGIADVRGIDGAVQLQWDDRRLNFGPGSNDALLGAGIHAALGGAAPSGVQQFHLQLALRGTNGLDFVPIARNTLVTLSGRWPHPNFFGRFLPTTRTVSDQGFHAQWLVSELASTAPRAFLTCSGDACAAIAQERFGVALIEPVDIYLQSLRAANYGFLFIGLTFVVFLLFELIAALRVHGMQYTLVGLALAVFFLLLFALAEHIDFAWAYLVAATACIALITFYVSHLLRSATRASLFSLYLVGLYGALYLLLRSEDYAMLLGALLVFTVLALTMVLTRRMDWYVVMEQGIAVVDVPA